MTTLKDAHRIWLQATFAVSAMLAVNSTVLADIETSKSDYRPNETIEIRFNSMPGGSWDTIVLVGATSSNELATRPIGGEPEGSVTFFEGLPPGEYEALYYENFRFRQAGPNGEDRVLHGRYAFRVTDQERPALSCMERSIPARVAGLMRSVAGVGEKQPVSLELGQPVIREFVWLEGRSDYQPIRYSIEPLPDNGRLRLKVELSENSGLLFPHSISVFTGVCSPDGELSPEYLGASTAYASEGYGPDEISDLIDEAFANRGLDGGDPIDVALQDRGDAWPSQIMQKIPDRIDSALANRGDSDDAVQVPIVDSWREGNTLYVEWPAEKDTIYFFDVPAAVPSSGRGRSSYNLVVNLFDDIETELLLTLSDGENEISPAGDITVSSRDPFRLHLKYARPPETQPQEVTLTWSSEDEVGISLLATEDPLLFSSEWHQLSSYSMRDFRELEDVEEANEKWTTDLAGRLFKGNWQVTQSATDSEDSSVGEGYGIAKISEDGTKTDFFIKTGDDERHYRSFEILATEDAEESNRTLLVRFASVQANSRPVSVPNGQRVLVVFIPDDTERVTFAFEGQSLSADVAVTMPSPSIRVDLSARSDDRLAGTWSEETLGGDLRYGGQVTWTRGATIEGILVLDDQLKTRSAGTVMDETATYPFAEGADPSAKRTRTLFVYGRNLPTSVGDAIVLSSNAPAIDYEIKALPGQEDALFEEGWTKVEAGDAGVSDSTIMTFREAGSSEDGTQDRSALSAVLVTATLREGVTSGVKGLTLNAVPGVWHLTFADASGIFYFAHQWREQDFTATDTAYSSDVVHLVINEESPIPIEQIPIEVTLVRDTQTILTQSLAARRIGSPAKAEYQSPPIRVIRSDRSDYSPPEQPEAVTFDVRPGDVLYAEPVDQLLLNLIPLPPDRAYVEVLEPPGDLGQLWSDALARMAVCHGDTDRDFSRITHEEAEEYSKIIVTELGARNVRINKGDHAAAILVRDEMISMMTPHIETYNTLVRQNDQTIAQFMEYGRNSDEILWRVIKGEDGRGEEVPLRDLLDFENRAASWGMTSPQAQSHAVKEVREGIVNFLELTTDARARAEDAGDCDVLELMEIAGHSNEGVVANLLPRLVRLAEGEDGEYWVPDIVAQGYVTGLFVTGGAVRALEAYGRVDDAYMALGFVAASFGAAAVAAAVIDGAIVTGVGKAALSTAARRAAVKGLIAADSFDAAVFGVYKGVFQHYFPGRGRVDYARGVTPVSGDDFLVEAELAAHDGLWTAIGVLAPLTLGVGGGLAQLKALRNAEALSRGRALLATIDEFDEATMARLSDQQRSDLAGVYADLQARRAKAGTSAIRGEQDNFAKFDRYFDSARRSADERAAHRALDSLGEIAGSAVARASQAADDLADVRRAGDSSDGGLIGAAGGTRTATTSADTTLANVTGMGAGPTIEVPVSITPQARRPGQGYDVDLMSRIEERLGTTFSDDQRRAMQRAHEVGEGPVFNYTPAEIRQKWRILREADIPVESRKVLLREEYLGRQRNLNPQQMEAITREIDNLADSARHTAAAETLPQELTQLRRHVESGNISPADLADLIKSADETLIAAARSRRGADGVGFTARHGLSEQVRRLPPEVQQELARHMDNAMGLGQTFYRSPVDELETGISVERTSRQLRDDVQFMEYRDPLGRPGRPVGRMEADHIVPVKSMEERYGKRLTDLDPDLQRNLLHDENIIQPLPWDLNNLKRNYDGITWARRMEANRTPLSADYLEWLINREREVWRYLDDKLMGLEIEQANRRNRQAQGVQ